MRKFLIVVVLLAITWDTWAQFRRRDRTPTPTSAENLNYANPTEYTIADIATWPWYGNLVLNNIYGGGEFLDAQSYKNVVRWANEIAERPAVIRGRKVNKAFGAEPQDQLLERHDASDFDTNTEDKRQARGEQ